jgi:hypothetical protein
VSRTAINGGEASTRDDFQIAFERARGVVGEDLWMSLSPHEQTSASYRELRALDTERAGGQVARSRSHR